MTTTISRESWTPLQIAAADHAAAEGALHAAVLDLELAEFRLQSAEENLLEGDGWSKDELIKAEKHLVETTARVAAAADREQETRRQLQAVTRLTRERIASRAGISPATWMRLVATGQAPAPDGHTDDGVPWWTELAVQQWMGAVEESCPVGES